MDQYLRGRELRLVTREERLSSREEEVAQRESQVLSREIEVSHQRAEEDRRALDLERRERELSHREAEVAGLQRELEQQLQGEVSRGTSETADRESTGSRSRSRQRVHWTPVDNCFMVICEWRLWVMLSRHRTPRLRLSLPLLLLVLLHRTLLPTFPWILWKELLGLSQSSLHHQLSCTVRWTLRRWLSSRRLRSLTCQRWRRSRQPPIWESREWFLQRSWRKPPP